MATGKDGESQEEAVLKLTKKGRAAARRRMRRGMNPTQNNPNDVGAKIIPQGTPSTL